MDYRVEHKYLVPDRLREALRHVIAPFTQPDRHATPRHDALSGSYLGYTVRSIYFDTADFAHYYANEDGLPVRFKPRIRGYDTLRTDSVAFLEVKGRNGAVGSKARAPILAADIAAFLEQGDPGVFIHDSPAYPEALASARQFIYRLRRFALRPVVMVAYDREPHVGMSESSLRITFDTNLRSEGYPTLATLYADSDPRPSLPGHFVLEVKHDAHFGFPTWLRPFLSRHGVVRRALSKYYICTTEHDIVRASSTLRTLASTEWITGASRIAGGPDLLPPPHEASPWIP